MIRQHEVIRFEIDKTRKVPTCFPVDLDRDHFVEITAVDDFWAVFLDEATGKIHNCVDYYNQSLTVLEG